MTTSMTKTRAALCFSQDDSQRAYNEWGANCGPNALAFALGITLDEVRPFMGDFERKLYTNPTLMKESVAAAGGRIGKTVNQQTLRILGSNPVTPSGLMRVQWCGPWTLPGANPRWAYGQTHWVAPYWNEHRQWVFDCNGGCMEFDKWRSEIVPLLVKGYPRATGEWFATHAWEIL